MARYSIEPGVSVSTSERPHDWIAEAARGTWESGRTEAEAIGKLMITLATAHDADCRRLWHYGPCRGPLRFERPETPAEAYERHVAAVESTLRRQKIVELDLDPDDLRDLAQALLAAADVGF